MVSPNLSAVGQEWGACLACLALTASHLCALFVAAEADLRDQGLPADGAQEGRQVRQDQEVEGRRQIQGALQQVPLHALREGPREGRQIEAVAAARFDGEGHLMSQ